MTPEQEQKLDELYEFMESMKASASIPFEVDAALRDRLSALTGLTVSGKGANSEDQTVDEAGAASYAVLNDPVGFLQVDIGGTTYYLPYYSA